MSDKVIYVGKKKASRAVVFAEGLNDKLDITVAVNKKRISLKEYLMRDVLVNVALSPISEIEANHENVKLNYKIFCKLSGGGLSGQAFALRHAIAKSIVGQNEEYKKFLRSLGFLTRDARIVERKKYGQAKARKRYQFSKR